MRSTASTLLHEMVNHCPRALGSTLIRNSQPLGRLSVLTFRKLTALLSCASLAFGAAAANANPYPCFYSDEQQSARIHDFQILMMVGALKCRDVAPASVGRYGALLAQRDGEMAAHGDRLLSRLIDEYGYREGRRAFDTYETTLSNAYSERQLTRETCEDMGAQARMALEASPAELETLARLASRREIDVCEADGAARVIAPRTRPLVAAYPEERPAVRVFRGAVPPQIAEAARAEASVSAAAREFPDMVAAPVAEPQLEGDAALAADADDAVLAAAAAASSAATRVAEAEAQTVAAAAAASPVEAPPADRLEAAISALDNAANALRDLRDEQAVED